MGECVYDSEEGEFVDFATLEDWEMLDKAKNKRIEALEAKLAKAVEVAEESIKWLRLYGADVHREAATLAELTGGKDE